LTQPGAGHETTAMEHPSVTAAVLLIGDELLSGRTRDVNLQAIAAFLAPLGVPVMEARIVADDQNAIVAALNALRGAYTYVFTTGGIGPTHDDITADAVAAAFEVGISERQDALDILLRRYEEKDLTPARRRMARVPDGATLIANPTSGAPGFKTGNVFTLAGVPQIMRSMLEDCLPHIEGGRVVASRTVRGKGLREGAFGDALGAIAKRHPDVSIGSYPWFGPEGYGAHLVARATDTSALEAAFAEMIALVRAEGAEPEVIDS
jgi:molybdenum cofactor synthesis domain-containing protein